jgi:steroid 5-alpha reductase family enzyme
MDFLQVYIQAALAILIMMIILWIISIVIKNVSIVDLFWGFGYVLAAAVYYYYAEGNEIRKLIIMILTAIWGLRLTVYLSWRNIGKGEDYRYQEFRKNFGAHRYWWFSFFQTFLLQGVLMWLVSAPLLAAMYYGKDYQLNVIDYMAIIIWVIGFIFEAGGDYQLARFKSDANNKGKVLNTGLWKYTRHPNYFGDSTIWWAFGLFSIAAGSYLPVLGSVLMTLLLIKVSGVALLERSLKDKKPEYNEYIRRTSAFFPWPPKKINNGMDPK